MGRPDVSDEIGAKDADALFKFLTRRGLIEGDAGPLPKALCDATGTNACEIIESPGAGFVTYCKELGAQVKKGDQIATLIDLTAEKSSRSTHTYFTQEQMGFSLPGDNTKQ